MRQIFCAVILVHATADPIAAQWTATTSSATNVTAMSVTLNGFTACAATPPNACPTMASRGFVWGTSTDRAQGTEVAITSLNSASAFSKDVTGLAENTTYYYWTFVKSKGPTVYGTQMSFKTYSLTAPEKGSAGSITGTSALLSATRAKSPGQTPTQGFIWSTTTTRPPLNTPNKCTGMAVPVIPDATYSCTASGLAQTTTYHVWPFATYSNGVTKYGAKFTFTTLTLPTITTTTATQVSYNSATAGGNVTSAGSSPVTSRGVAWGTSANPTGNKTTNGTGTGAFTSALSGLPDGSTIHIRAYATSSAGTAYGNDLTFNTPNSPPDLQARPTSSSQENRPLLVKSGGQFDAGGTIRQGLSAALCNSLTLGAGTDRVFTYSNTGNLNCGNNCIERAHQVTLPAVIYKAENTGHTGAGQFSVSLHRQLKLNGSDGQLTQVASQVIQGLDANKLSSVFSYQPPEPVTIYTYPSSYSGSDIQKFCYAACIDGSCNIPFAEKAYLVKVDGGNSANGGQVVESNEGNNEGNPMP